jgi:nitrate/nitrite transporter NarK
MAKRFWGRDRTAYLTIDITDDVVERAVIRQDLNLTRSGVSGANVASVCGAIFARISMGTFTDAFGPRMGFSMLLTLSSSAGKDRVSSARALLAMFQCLVNRLCAGLGIRTCHLQSDT